MRPSDHDIRVKARNGGEQEQRMTLVGSGSAIQREDQGERASEERCGFTLECLAAVVVEVVVARPCLRRGCRGPCS